MLFGRKKVLERTLAVLAVLAVLGWSGCKKHKEGPTQKRTSAPKARGAGGSLVIYSGRSKSLVRPLIEMFQKKTGIQVKVKYAKTTQLALLLKMEASSGKSNADVFWAQDGGALGLLEQDGLFAPLDAKALAKIPVRFRNARNLWVATSGRARVLAYSPKRVKAAELPKDVFALTAPKWKGRVGWAPTNASFQAFVTAMRVAAGEEKTKTWLQAMKKNGAKSYPKNTAIVKAIAAGEVDLGLPNHYYLLRFKKKDDKYPVEQTFFADGNIGNLVNIAGVGVLKKSKNQSSAKRFVAFLLSKEAQQFITDKVFEYPLLSDVKANKRLVPLDTLLQKTPKLALGKLRDLKGTLKLLTAVGLP